MLNGCIICCNYGARQERIYLLAWLVVVDLNLLWLVKDRLLGQQALQPLQWSVPLPTQPDYEKDMDQSKCIRNFVSQNMMTQPILIASGRFVRWYMSEMAAAFLPSWILCLNEGMSIWFQRWTCPGWVFCPRNITNLANQYLTICCGLSGALFSMEMVEGKDFPC